MASTSGSSRSAPAGARPAGGAQRRDDIAIASPGAGEELARRAREQDVAPPSGGRESANTTPAVEGRVAEGVGEQHDPDGGEAGPQEVEGARARGDGEPERAANSIVTATPSGIRSSAS